MTFERRRAVPSIGGGAGVHGPYDIVFRAEVPGRLYEIRMDLYQERWWLVETTSRYRRILSETEHGSLEAAMLALTMTVVTTVRSQIVVTHPKEAEPDASV